MHRAGGIADARAAIGRSAAVGPAKTFWIYALVSLFSFVFVLFFIPETKGRTLEQIEKMWSAAGPAQSPEVRNRV